MKNRVSVFIFVVCIGLTIGIALNFFTRQNLTMTEKSGPKPTKAVLGKNDKDVASKKASPSAAVTPQLTTKKKSYTIALIGDSMIDTMGENTEYLQASLSKKYPATTFHLYNYGIGAQNVQMGLDRFSSAFNNRERHYPSIPDLHPDIIIVGSFAYNPFFPHDKNRHYTVLTQLVKQAKTVTPAVYILVEIAPLRENFGKGQHGPNMTEDAAIRQALAITEQLDNAIAVGNSLGVPVINAYSPSKANGNYGSGVYTNPDDGIHPSAAGHTFTANLIARTLRL